MRPWWNLIAFACVSIGIVVAVLAWVNLRGAQRSLDSTMRHMNAVQAQLIEYRTLSASQQDTLLGTKPQQDVELRIARTIEHAGINPRPRYSITVQADRELAGSGRAESSGLREQEITVRIPGLSVQQMGAFLIDWRQNQQVWNPTSIELIHDQRAKDSRYTLQLNCTAVYHADGAS